MPVSTEGEISLSHMGSDSQTGHRGRMIRDVDTLDIWMCQKQSDSFLPDALC